MFKVQGGCHCKNIQVLMELSRPVETYEPRACDCDSCVQHGAAYLSDPQGSLILKVSDKKLLGHYRQGSHSADFLFCQGCGVLIGVSYEEKGQIYMAINSRALLEVKLKDAVNVSPKKLEASDKVKRWKEVWFSRCHLPE